MRLRFSFFVLLFTMVAAGVLSAKSDIGPLVSNPGIGKWDEVKLRRNPLNDEAYDVHIPALQERGVKVSFDPRD